MPTKKRKIPKKKVKRKSLSQSYIIDYERIAILIAPFVVITLFILVYYIVQVQALPRIEDFFSLKTWQTLFKKEATSPSSQSWTETPDVVLEDPPPLPEIDENLPLVEIMIELEETIVEMGENNFTSALLQKIHDEAQQELAAGNVVAAKEKLLLEYKLAQEMYFAYQNKLIRFRESTQSAN